MELEELMEFDHEVKMMFKKATSDDEFIAWNSQLNELGRKIHQYGGHELYRRDKNLVRILEKTN